MERESLQAKIKKVWQDGLKAKQIHWTDEEVLKVWPKGCSIGIPLRIQLDEMLENCKKYCNKAV